MPEQLLLLRSYHDSNVGVDRATNTIRGIKVIEIGPINDGRPYLVDQETLRQVVALGNAPNKGLKCRYTHADFSEDAIGTHLGRWFNFRVDSDCVRADLKLAQSSRLSPKGDIGGYVLELATEDPESFGASIAAELDRDLMESVEGGKMPLRLSSLYSVDIVNEPAATRGGLFSKEFTMAEEAAPEKKEEEKEMDFSFLTSEMSPEEKLAKVAEMLGVEMPEKKEEMEEHEEEPKEEEKKEEEEMEEESPPEEKKEEEMEEKSPEEKKKEEKLSAKRYMELFGDRGARWYLEGKSLEHCFKEQLKEVREENVKLSQQVDQMVSQVKAAKAISGEAEPASLSVAKTADDIAREAFEARKLELARKGIDEKTVRWGQAFASISKPKN